MKEKYGRKRAVQNKKEKENIKYKKWIKPRKKRNKKNKVKWWYVFLLWKIEL